MPSSVIRVSSPMPGPAAASLEIECTILNEGIPAVIVDCRGQRQVSDGGHITDPFLGALQRLGFIPARKVVSSGVLLEFTLHGPSALSARLVRDRLTISAAGQVLMADAPLSFLPQWYHATRANVIVSRFG